MIDERDPLYRSAMAPFEDELARYRGAMAEIDEEYTKKAEEFEKEVEERKQQDGAQFAALAEKMRALDERSSEDDQSAKNPWLSSRQQQETVLSFGAEDGEQDAASQPLPPAQQAMPTPPMGFAAPGFSESPGFSGPAGFSEPGAAEPAETAQDDQSRHVMSFDFGEDENVDEEHAPPQAQPQPRTSPPAGRRARHAAEDDDDDDRSVESWLR